METEAMRSAITEFSAMGYLAAFFYAQGEVEESESVVRQMSEVLSTDRSLAKALDQYLEVVCKRFGYDLVRSGIDPKKDQGMH